MLLARSDLPFDRDATSGFLPWLVALMVFLATLALAGSLMLGNILDRWNRDVSGTLTVQVLPAAGEADSARARTQARVDTVTGILERTPGITHVRVLTEPELRALVEPWLGSTDLVADLPLPRLIDVGLNPQQRPSLEALELALRAAVPDIQIDDHKLWLRRLVHLAGGLELLAAAILAMVAFATAATVTYATWTSLAIHNPVIEVLHLIGARDAYVARQFGRRMLGLGLRGGVVGFLLSAVCLELLMVLTRRVEEGLLAGLELGTAQWMALVLVPAGGAVLVSLTARVTVLRTLGRMT